MAKNSAIDTVRLMGAAFILFLLFNFVVSRYEPAWFNFMLLSILIMTICAVLSRLITWVHDYFFE